MTIVQWSLVSAITAHRLCKDQCHIDLFSSRISAARAVPTFPPNALAGQVTTLMQFNWAVNHPIPFHQMFLSNQTQAKLALLIEVTVALEIYLAYHYTLSSYITSTGHSLE